MKTVQDEWKESTTFKLVLVSWLAVLVKYLGADLDFGFGPVASMSVGEFSTGVAAILAIWLGREWKEAHYARKD